MNVGLLDILKILKKRWIIILCIMISITSVVGIINFFIIKPTYECETKLFIGKDDFSKDGYNNDDVQMYQRLLKTYSELVQTKNLIENTLEKNHLDLTKEEVIDNLTVTQNSDSQIISISLKNNDKYVARDLLQNIADEFISETKILIPNVKVEIVENVELPKGAISPKRQKNLMLGALGGVMSGIAIALLMEYINDTLRNKEQIENIIKVPVIGEIPFSKKTRKKNQIDRIQSEYYKKLRANVEYSFISKNFKTIMITSSKPREGKSTLVENLARSFDECGKKVIIIDCDLRRPSIHKRFDMPNLCGFSEVMIGKAELNKAIQVCNSKLHILTSGNLPLNPSEIINSVKMDSLLGKLREVYDLVIIDTPPLGLVVDAQIISTKVDGTILVVKAEDSTVKVTKESKSILERTGSKIIGIVINEVKDKCNNYIKYYVNNKKRLCKEN